MVIERDVLDLEELDRTQARPVAQPVLTSPQAVRLAQQGSHVYISVGHQQMMTDAMKPLGLSVWLLTALRPMLVAGSRLFVDVAQALASPASRAALVQLVGRSDPLIGDALRIIIDRGFIPTVPDQAPAPGPAGGEPAPIETDPAIVTG